MIRFFSFLKRLISKDLHWKILSLFMALILWFVVMNIINPTESKNFMANITMAGIDNLEEMGYTVLNKDEVANTNVNMKIMGTRPALDDLKSDTSLSRVSASINLSALSIDEEAAFPQGFSLKINPSVNESYIYSYDITSCSPNLVNVSIDKLSTVKRGISVVTSGKVASGFVAADPEYDDSMVTVKGPSSRMGEVSKIQGEVDLSGKNATFTSACTLHAYDSENNELTDFTIEPSAINVKVDIMSIGNVKINKPTTVGELPEGLSLDEIDWSPKVLTVQGKSSDLEQTASINLPPVHLDNITSSTSFTYSVSKLLQNPNIICDTQNVIVTVNVGPENAEENIVKKDISPGIIKAVGIDTNMLTYSISDVDVQLSGDADLINSITDEQINPVINLTGLEKGSHTININLDLPDGVIAVKNSATVVLAEVKNDKTDIDSQSAEITTAAPVAEIPAEEVTEQEPETEAEQQPDDVIDVYGEDTTDLSEIE